mmetsp:Transcript_27541/g.38855  ORF Transcript_27541/g.38855 Transcript_27541/m.38855 type:complete len:192 (+) Transcript_27541:74-649(+)
MGGNNVKGLFWMETIYPSENGLSVIPQEKLQKEIQKGTIKPQDPNADKYLDDDMDEKIDKVIREVWAYYDPKGTGVLPKKIIEKFFSDALELYALRMGRKGAKEVIAPGVNYSQAMAESVGKMTNTVQATFKQFEDFINCYDLEEGLGSFLGVRETTIKQNVQFVDNSQLAAQQQASKKPVYRDYSVLQND